MTDFTLEQCKKLRDAGFLQDDIKLGDWYYADEVDAVKEMSKVMITYDHLDWFLICGYEYYKIPDFIPFKQWAWEKLKEKGYVFLESGVCEINWYAKSKDTTGKGILWMLSQVSESQAIYNLLEKAGVVK